MLLLPRTPCSLLHALEFANQLFGSCQRLAPLVDRLILSPVLFLETFVGLARLPDIDGQVAKWFFAIADQFCANIPVAPPKEPAPDAIGCVGFFERSPLIRADTELPDNDKHR